MIASVYGKQNSLPQGEKDHLERTSKRMEKNNRKGFTLAELLIVVAIIAVLTMVAVPIFNTQLEKSREETDIANLRAAKAAAVAYYLDHPETTDAVYFNAANGTIQAAKTGIVGYGKGTTTNGNSDTYPNYSNTTSYVGQIVQVTKSTGAGNVETLTAEFTAAAAT